MPDRADDLIRRGDALRRLNYYELYKVAHYVSALPADPVGAAALALAALARCEVWSAGVTEDADDIWCVNDVRDDEPSKWCETCRSIAAYRAAVAAREAS